MYSCAPQTTCWTPQSTCRLMRMPLRLPPLPLLLLPAHPHRLPPPTSLERRRTSWRLDAWRCWWMDAGMCWSCTTRGGFTQWTCAAIVSSAFVHGCLCWHDLQHCCKDFSAYHPNHFLNMRFYESYHIKQWFVPALSNDFFFQQTQVAHCRVEKLR